jgi:argininosuccinate lyase
VLREADKQNISLTALPLDALKKISPAFEADFAENLNVEAALSTKQVPGGTAPENVRAAIADLEARLNKKTSKTGAKS